MPGKHTRHTTVVDYQRRTGDGQPQFTYFDPSSTLSFVWTGVPTDPIEVEVGGYGEPVQAVISRRINGTPLGIELGQYQRALDQSMDPSQMAHAMVHWFAHICTEWAAEIEKGREPQHVNEVKS